MKRKQEKEMNTSGEVGTKPSGQAAESPHSAPDDLTLKWGTLKGWSFPNNPKAMELITRYHELGASFSVMTQHDTPEQKQILCDLIDVTNNPDGIYLDWDGKYVSKEEAKKYIVESGRRDTA